MIKKIAAYFFIVFGLILLWASTSRSAMEYLSNLRDGEKWWGTYPCLHGDLVSMSYLDFIPKFVVKERRPHLDLTNYKGEKNTVLVLQGDSNTWHVGDSNFAAVSKLYYINRTNGGYYHIDTTKDNILLIEIGERVVRSYFQDTAIFHEIHDTGEARTSFLSLPMSRNTTKIAGMLPDISVNSFFNKFINQNLQFNLFNYNFAMPMFQSKAALNYFVFSRASGDAVISDDKQYLFLKETVTKYDNGSSYAPISDEEITHIADVLNNIYDHYKRAGFKEVYFSIIPNSATIVQPMGYNNLIPRIQTHPGLKINIIDIYSIFKSQPGDYYFHGDTHWNKTGKQLWINLVNKTLTENK